MSMHHMHRFAIATFVSLSSLAVACGDEEALADPVDETTSELFVDTSQLPKPKLGSSRTIFTMCWTDSARATGALKALFDAGRAAVRKEITDTWDVNSWADFVWRDTCAAGDIPITIADKVPNASRKQVTLNFKYANYKKAECAPTGGTGVNAAWTNCLKKNAVHEFGHVLGFDHEQNRGIAGVACPSGDVAEPDISDGSIVGDLEIGPADPRSVMAYCWQDRTIDLTASDIEGVQSIYGAEGRSVRDDKLYAVRVGSGVAFMDVTDGSFQTVTPLIEKAFRIDGPVASGAIKYGDKVTLSLGNKKLCATLGVGTQFGIVPPTLIFTSGPYDARACLWDVQHDSVGSGGSTVNVNDPVNFHLGAPTPPMEPNENFAHIAFNGSMSVRFLGAFSPL